MRLSLAFTAAWVCVAPAWGQPAPLPSVSYPTIPVAGAMQPSSVPPGRAGQAQAARNRDGHFYFRAEMNGIVTPMLVDTGASGVALRWEDAVSAGLNPDTLIFSTPTSTANGTAFKARARLRSLTVGGITRQNVPVTVSKAGALNVSLLGQTFLAQVTTVRISGDMLLLQE